MTTSPIFDLQAVQKVRKGAVLVALLGLVGLTMVSQSATGLDSPLHEGVEAVGLAAIVFAIVGQLTDKLLWAATRKPLAWQDSLASLEGNRRNA